MPLSRVVLASGRPIELSELRLVSTYDGMLEGYPCKLINDRKISSLPRIAERAFPGTPVHLIPPARHYPDQTAGPFGPVEVLPAVACIGAFRSTAVASDHDPVLYRSALTVIWFQPTPEVPSDDGGDPTLRSIPWDELAQDFEL